MKVIIFRDKDYGESADVVDGVNDWLNKNPGVKIKFIKQSLARATFIITVWYLE